MLQIMPLLLWVMCLKQTFNLCFLPPANTFTARATFNITSDYFASWNNGSERWQPSSGYDTP